MNKFISRYIALFAIALIVSGCGSKKSTTKDTPINNHHPIAKKQKKQKPIATYIMALQFQNTSLEVLGYKLSTANSKGSLAINYKKLFPINLMNYRKMELMPSFFKLEENVMRSIQVA